MTAILPRRTVLALAATALVAVAATACGAENTPATKGVTTGTANSSVSKDGTDVTTIGAEKIKLRGDKPTALFFFSVGCGECAGGAKSLSQAGKQLNGKANVLAVDMDPSESPQIVRQFLDYIKAPGLSAFIDHDATLSRTYKVAALSTLIVVNPAGKVTFRATDPGSDRIQAALEKAGAV